MTVVQGQIEPLKRLREEFVRRGIERFNSIADVKRFTQNYDAEVKQVPDAIDTAFEVEMQGMHAALSALQQYCEQLKRNVRGEIAQKIHELEIEITRADDKSRRSVLCGIFYFIKLKKLRSAKSRLEKNLDSIERNRTRDATDEVVRLAAEISQRLANKNTIISERCRESFDDLARTKEVVDGLYTLVAGAIGESAVVKVLRRLSDDCYLLNDFSLKFNPPIYDKNEHDRIFSIQIDHLLICRSGVFILETKHWSRSSVENRDLRSPVRQILRTNYALFSLLNGDSRFNEINLERHHWGSRKIPVRNVIVMTNERPKEEFRHVKVLSPEELNGYVEYFEQLFSVEEVRSIFQCLKGRIGANTL